jgi:hypothetical protein
MSLADMVFQAKIQAERTGTDRPLNLSGGARIVIRVQGDITTLTISRQKKRVGDRELITFKRDCGVPDDAIRFPLEGQNSREVEGVTWWYVAYRWAEGVDQ